MPFCRCATCLQLVHLRVVHPPEWSRLDLPKLDGLPAAECVQCSSELNAGDAVTVRVPREGIPGLSKGTRGVVDALQPETAGVRYRVKAEGATAWFARS